MKKLMPLALLAASLLMPGAVFAQDDDSGDDSGDTTEEEGDAQPRESQRRQEGLRVHCFATCKTIEDIPGRAPMMISDVISDA